MSRRHVPEVGLEIVRLLRALGVIHMLAGSSRTADIELTLTRGVHGPKEVHAIFVDAPIRG